MLSDDEDGEDGVGLGPAAGGNGEGKSAEGRRVRGPSIPYVPTEKERREHNLSHYPHRTWCECCMAGRAVAGKHAPSADDSDPRACEFHFDYCFLKNVSKEEAAVTLVGVGKSSDGVVAHAVPEKGTRFGSPSSSIETSRGLALTAGQWLKVMASRRPMT